MAFHGSAVGTQQKGANGEKGIGGVPTAQKKMQSTRNEACFINKQTNNTQLRMDPQQTSMMWEISVRVCALIWGQPPWLHWLIIIWTLDMFFFGWHAPFKKPNACAVYLPFVVVDHCNPWLSTVDAWNHLDPNMPKLYWLIQRNCSNIGLHAAKNWIVAKHVSVNSLCVRR